MHRMRKIVDGKSLIISLLTVYIIHIMTCVRAIICSIHSLNWMRTRTQREKNRAQI